MTKKFSRNMSWKVWYVREIGNEFSVGTLVCVCVGGGLPRKKVFPLVIPFNKIHSRTHFIQCIVINFRYHQNHLTIQNDFY